MELRQDITLWILCVFQGGDDRFCSMDECRIDVMSDCHQIQLNMTIVLVPDNVYCPSFWKLAGPFIHYKRQIQTIYDKHDLNDDIRATVQANIFINDEMYQDIFVEPMESVTFQKFTQEPKDILKNMYTNNRENIGALNKDQELLLLIVCLYV